MPRLQGKRSNNNLYFALMLVLAVIAIILLNYFGVIHLIPNFGRT
jgi:hypothetical protein